MAIKNEKDNVRTSYYNRVMSKDLKELLQNGGKFHWLIDFVKDSTHKELDFQNTENQFSIYRGTSKVLTLHQNGKIDAHKSYMDNFPEYYGQELWNNNNETILKPKLEELLDKIGDNKEQFGRYYINVNGKKMEGYYQNLVSRKYTFNWSHNEKLKDLVIFDKEFQIGNLPYLEGYDTNWADCIIEKLKNDISGNGLSFPKTIQKSHKQCDFVGIKKKKDNENKYELVLLEVKRRTKEDDENVYLAPLQIATYYMLLREYIKKHRENLKTVIMEMIDQKQKLGLIENVNKLDKSSIDFNKIHLAIVFGGKIDELTRKKFNIVKKIVEEKHNEEEKKEKEIKTMIDNKIKLFTCMDNGGKEEEQGTLKPLDDLIKINNGAYNLSEDSYRDNEKAWQIKLLCSEKDEQLFDGAKGGGLYDGKTYPHVLQCGKKNLFEEIRNSAIGYFSAYGIPWHKGCKGCKECEGCEVCKECKGGPTGNTLSSQIACLNHLFAIRDDKEAVKALVQGINKKFVCVSPIPDAYDKKKNKKAEKQNKDNSENENKKVYISFEVVSDKDHLGEGTPTRGANCTSIDALICAIDEKGNKCLIVIEWKYTEKFSTDDKSSGDSGETRMRHYNDLINCSKLLVHLSKDGCKYPENIKDYQGSIYYKETFYQLMRQTLWSEQMIANKSVEKIEAVDYIHLHVVPKGNEQLRTKRWKESGKTMEETWKEMLTKDGQERYKTIDPEELLEPIKKLPNYEDDYKKLFNYLRTRYWDRPSETTNDNQDPSAK